MTTRNQLSTRGYSQLYPISVQQPKFIRSGKVQVGKDQEKAQSEKDSHSKNQGGKQTN